MLLTFLSKNLHEVDQNFRSLFQAATRVEFQFAVKIRAAGKQIWSWQSFNCQSCAIGAAANGFEIGLDAGATRGLDRVVSQLRKVLQLF